MRVEGILGENSAVKNNLKFGLGVRTWIYFSRSDNHEIGARWIFFNITHNPPFEAFLIACSACLAPSSLPIAIDVSLVPIYLLVLSTLKLGSNPGALLSIMGYLALTEEMTFLISNVWSSIALSPRTNRNNEWATIANLSGLKILMRIQSTIFCSTAVSLISNLGMAC